MASSLLDLDDLIEFQLDRLKLDELNFKDELQLQRQLLDLDALQCPQRRHKTAAMATSKLANQHHQALQVPEASSCIDLPTSFMASSNQDVTPAAIATGAIARSSSRKSRASAGVGGSVQNVTTTNGSIEIAMEELGATGGAGTGSVGAAVNLRNCHSFSDSEDDGLALDQQKEFR